MLTPVYPKDSARGRAYSTKHWRPQGKRETHLPTRKGLTAPKGFNQQAPLSALSREGCSGPGRLGLFERRCSGAVN